MRSEIPAIVLLVITGYCCTRIEHGRTVSVRINGNCSMCEATIEEAAAMDGAVRLDWDRTTRVAQLTYDTTRTTVAAVLDRVAAAGYDTERSLAPDGAYDKLPLCCRYQRTGDDIRPPRPNEQSNH